MKTKFFKKPQVWCFSTYFAEGLPHGIVRLMSSVFFTDIGMKERYIGYLNFLGIPWNLKFLWAPLLDIVGKKRTWMIVFQTAVTLSIGTIACICKVAAHHGPAGAALAAMAGMFVATAFLAASNDIAIDGYYMEGLRDPREQALYTGYRVFAYRLALILARSGFVGIAAYFAGRLGGADKFTPWSYAFGAASLTMLFVTLFHVWNLPRFETNRACDSSGERTFAQKAERILKQFVEAFVSYSKQKRFALVVVFIVFYKIGDEMLFSMGTPFLMRELAVTKAQLAWVGGLLGAFGAIIGTALGGIWIKKKGLKKSIWPLTLLMNVNIWAYIWLAYVKPSALTTAGIWTIAAAHCYEQMAAGLGNAVLVVFILRTCKPEFKASHYAIGSAIMSLFSTFFGGFGGVIVERIGYLHLFQCSFFASIPSMLLLLWVPIKEEN
jgi:PAT family beta-lactamase induction signal transducer AmpG